MPFDPTIPQPTDLLSDSQTALLANNGFLNTSFGTDHYPFNDATTNNGKHQVIQMPVQTAIPSTVLDPKFYSYQQPTGNAGVLQYLKGPNDEVQSPLLPLQSAATGISLASAGTATVFDFTGMIYCYGIIMASGIAAVGLAANPVMSMFFWSGSQGFLSPATTANKLSFQFVGSLLEVINIGTGNVNSVAWTLKFERILTPL